MSRKGYIILNSVFIIIIAGIFSYSFFVNALDTHTVCVHKKYLDIDCPSCGLTRSFSAILHQHSDAAFEWNKYGWQIFLFFSIQLVMRILFLLFTVLPGRMIRLIAKIDGVISSVLFVICFYPFIFSTFYLFYKMVITGNVDL